MNRLLVIVTYLIHLFISILLFQMFNSWMCFIWLQCKTKKRIHLFQLDAWLFPFWSKKMNSHCCSSFSLVSNISCFHLIFFLTKKYNFRCIKCNILTKSDYDYSNYILIWLVFLVDSDGNNLVRLDLNWTSFESVNWWLKFNYFSY